MTRRALPFLAALFLFGGLAIWITADAAPKPEALHRSYVFGHTVTGAANILTTSITPNRAGKLSVSVAIVSSGTNSVFNVLETHDPSGDTEGSQTSIFSFNTGSALVAGNGYQFEWDCHPNATYNFTMTTGTVIGKLQVTEIQGGGR